MPRWNLSDLSKKSAKNQAEVIAQMGPKTELPVSSPTSEVETPPEPKERARRTGSEIISEVVAKRYPRGAIDQSPVDVPVELIRHILNSFAGPFYVAKDETQRRAVVQHAVQVLARREANPNSIP